MSPDFDELIGDGDEATPEELAGLRTVHDLLASAAPPPELPRRLARPPRPPRERRRRRAPRRWGVLAAAAPAAVGCAFAIGFVFGHGGGLRPSFTREMHGLAPVAAATATIKVGPRDPSGNWPLDMSVRGLPALPRGDWYQLYLTRRGEPDVLCGSFRTGDGAVTDVRMNAPSDLAEYSGWIVTAHVSGATGRALLST